LRHLPAPFPKSTQNNCNKPPDMQQTARADGPQNGRFAVFAWFRLPPGEMAKPSRARGKKRSGLSH
jgi:hypothetical protein